MGDLFSLKGKIAFVSGAGGNFGHWITKGLWDAGAHVLLNGRNKDRVEAVRKMASPSGERTSLYCFDITKESDRVAAVDSIRKEFGRVDVLVNNAWSGKPSALENSTIKDFESGFDVGVVAPFRLIQLMIPMMKGRGTSSIINVASMYGNVSPDPRVYGDSGQNSSPYYSAAKGAVIQLTRYLAVHLAAEGIRVNSISPGPFPAEGTKADFVARLAQKVPLARVGKSEEMQGPVIFLASNASSYVTGTDLHVDGGWTAW